jgi:hypothetical protein
MTKKLDEAFAAFDKVCAELDARDAALAAKAVAPKGVVKMVVEVPKAHPSHTAENRGRLEVDVIRQVAPTAPPRRNVEEEMYWAAVRREFAWTAPALVVSVYDPIKRFEEGY